MVKLMYSVRLAPDTKCPTCNTPIALIAAGTYTCYSGHIIEPFLIVTNNKPRGTQAVKVVGGAAEEAIEYTPAEKVIKQ